MPESSIPKIVIMGTPDFAVASAAALSRCDAVEIAAVVTVPDKPAGRGQQLRESEMKLWAKAQKLPVLQPENLRDAGFLQAMQNFDAQMFIVVAFRILPPEVFTMPPRGTINLHASLLPKYRGAAPINWAIIEGERETGVTTFLIDEKVDTGNMLLQRRTAIGDEETAGEVYDRLKLLGADLLVETVQNIVAGILAPQPQTGTPTKAPKITPDIQHIDWQQPAERIRNLVRGLSPYPTAFAMLGERRLKIYKCRVHSGDLAGAPGQILVADSRNGFVVCAGEHAVRLDEMQLEGKKRMGAAEFLRGFAVRVGDVLT